ncbi:N-acetylmuramoyl-L-alanine amidase family protein [Pseudobacteroides cellulosolvens]|uniref:Cell wall hydrolase/autolysin n=1 Tax=Pseudobacteroides cellulosolvens ATCC 35603 = DSM 2933 TaxID=398512 RepID=A0A0L6JH98_9FIRM|nr:N-acetylmuramoyl-L-alanine amidase [Pseudobacteroides cellulosolvens]KNY25090.1 cell wall hydrolase/autolysin [Pseudobacteroides cellulosolvens ATCC 35603 = DSM 2933]
MRKKIKMDSLFVRSLVILLSVLFVILNTAFFFNKYIMNAGSPTFNDKNDKIQSGTVTEKITNVMPTPTPVKKEVLLLIDPGHGGEDLGTYFDNIYEKVLNLDISLKLGKLLENDGFKVLFTRKEDVFVGLKERSDLANEKDATLFLSIHNNNMPDSPNYKGTETLYCPGSSGNGKINGERFAQIVQEELVKRLGTIDNGIIARPNLSVLRRTQMAAVIAEIGYISNYSDRIKLNTEYFRQEAAVALHKAVKRTLDEMNVKKQPDNRWIISG